MVILAIVATGNILGKLQLTRRAELIRWAADHDIR